MLYIYDYLLTLADEVSAIWPSKFTGAKLIFLLNRYSFLLYSILSIVGQTYQHTQLTGFLTSEVQHVGKNIASMFELQVDKLMD